MILIVESTGIYYPSQQEMRQPKQGSLHMMKKQGRLFRKIVMPLGIR
jgi:hypothetical protein